MKPDMHNQGACLKLKTSNCNRLKIIFDNIKKFWKFPVHGNKCPTTSYFTLFHIPITQVQITAKPSQNLLCLGVGRDISLLFIRLTGSFEPLHDKLVVIHLI